MSKLVLLLAVAAFGCKLITGRWPWEFLNAPARSDALRRARALLGVARLASREDIIEAHRRLITLVHPDRGGSADQVHEANAARDLLLAQLPAK
jgi:hypothetical protein